MCMASNYLSNLARAHFQTAIVWLLMPLSIINGQTIAGCGCTGHFEAACHCSSCDSYGSGGKPEAQACNLARVDDGSQRLCCCRSHSTAPTQRSSQSPDEGETNGFRSHQCTQLILHIGEPVPTVSLQFNSELDLASVHAALISRLDIIDVAAHQRVFVIGSEPPPCDFVVTLHRLII
jgi:hypothetical protein